MLKQVDKINYRVVREIAVLSNNDNITTELNLISYNNYKPKLDLRKWQQKGDNKLLQRGLTLTDEEALTLRDALTSYLDAIASKEEAKKTN